MKYITRKVMMHNVASIPLWFLKQKEKVNNILSMNQNEINKASKFQLLQVAIGLCFVAILTSPEASCAISDISDIKSLTSQVKTQVQGSGMTLVLNAAGIGTALVALITSRWTTLLFGAAYLIFVNGYFGYVNGTFK